MRRFSAGAVLAVAVVVAWAGAPAAAANPARITVAGSAGQAVAISPGHRVNGWFCKELGVRYQASAAAQMACFGPRGSTARRSGAGVRDLATPANVDAANLAEDVTASGVRAYGQSEVSVAAAGGDVVEAWNDSTGLFSSCPSPQFKEERIGLGFSADGGRSFSDLGGLPNNQCTHDIYLGDPSVAAYRAGGRTYFYVSGLYANPSFTGITHVAMAPCTVTGRGRAAKLRCGEPVIVASSPACIRMPHAGLSCSFLDKDFLAVDPARGRLYASYSVFSVTGHVGIQLAVCDLGTRNGGRGQLGGTPSRPVCENGRTHRTTRPYLTIAPGDRTGCEDEGAYPAVAPSTGAVYVGYEFNWFSNANPGPCQVLATTEVLTKVPLRCLPLAPGSPCAGPAARTAVPVTSMDQARVPHNGPLNDFPRVAVSLPAGTVSMVWNDARRHPLGDILLQSFGLRSLAPVQHSPVVLNTPSGGWHIYPAARAATPAGLLDVSWYAGMSARAHRIGVNAVLGLNPRLTAPPRFSTAIASVTWNPGSVQSFIGVLGDYTDNNVAVTGRPPYLSRTLFVAWSDGRLGVAQPFLARLSG